MDHAFEVSLLLQNKHGKCLGIETKGKRNPSENGAKVVQANCNPSEKGQLWKWDTNTNFLCNDWLKCISVSFNQGGYRAYDLFHWDTIIGVTKYQKWNVVNSVQFQNGGWCLASENNSDDPGVPAITAKCNDEEEGQMWSFV